MRTIKAYKNAAARKVHETGKTKGFKGLDGNRAVRVLNILENTTTIKELPTLAAYRFHKLKGNRQGQYSLTVNLPWVVCFTPAKGGGWEKVEITDYH